MISRMTAAALGGLLLAAWQATVVDACSRCTYKSNYGIFTGRSMDWYEDIGTDIYAFPAGMERNGGVGDNSLEWTSTYGSVVATIYGVATGDGINTKGLVANVLYLTEANHGNAWREAAGQKKLSIGAWAQYTLDQFATVAEAVMFWTNDAVNIIAPELPGGAEATAHLALSDMSGDNAIFEYIDGILHIHHNVNYTVMTNSPPFEQQLSIAAYFQEVGGLSFLPGTHRAADRFVRLTYNLNAVPKVDTDYESISTVMSLIRHISVPRGITDPYKPNLSSTIWRTVYNHKDCIMYYENIDSPSLFWVNLNKMNLTEGSPVKKLVYRGVILAGESSADFVDSPPFDFLAPEEESNVAQDAKGCGDKRSHGPCTRVEGCAWVDGTTCLDKDTMPCKYYSHHGVCTDHRDRCQWQSSPEKKCSDKSE